ncbi:MAG: nucleotidyltransferase domain-containing protein [Candidatus Cloacimonetes bacterium]|nr:nucleotidyltransferase domain-containing protein [Candidatus Cloacimonadota bacterium]
MQIPNEIKSIINEFSHLDEIQAITIGGSVSTGKADDKSDFDIYVYLDRSLEQNVRRDILTNFCKTMEIENRYWEQEDNVTLHNRTNVDIIYRYLGSFIREIADVVESGNARNGYTTCLWHNLLTAEIFFDREGELKKAKDRFTIPYPQILKKNIINRNMNLLTDTLVSYDKQIEKSIYRNDLVNLNNRITAFLDSYFDIIFALNELQHPGEKRIMEICKEKCEKLPNDFKENIDRLFSSLSNEPKSVSKNITHIIKELKSII